MYKKEGLAKINIESILLCKHTAVEMPVYIGTRDLRMVFDSIPVSLNQFQNIDIVPSTKHMLLRPYYEVVVKNI